VITRSMLLLLAFSLAPGCALLTGKTKKKKPTYKVTQVKAEGATSPTAAAHQGQIAFSKSPIERGPKSADAFETRFTLSDPIHMRPFMADSFHNLLAAQGKQYVHKHSIWKTKFDFHIQVNGEADPKKWPTLGVMRPGRRLAEQTTTWSPDASGDTSLTGQTEYPGRGAAYIFSSEVLPLLKVGDNEITVRAIGGGASKGPDGSKYAKVELAKGTFTLTVAAGDIARHIEKKGPKLVSKHPDEAQLVPLYKEALAKLWKNAHIRDVVTMSKLWDVKFKEISGRPIKRTVVAHVVLQNDDGTCKVMDMPFIQKYAGPGDQFHPDMEIGVALSAESKPFPCVPEKKK